MVPLTYAPALPSVIGQCRAVLNFFDHRGAQGATSNEVAYHLGVPLHSVTPRVLELRQAGLVVAKLYDAEGFPVLPGDQGGRVQPFRPDKRTTGSGKKAQVWRRAYVGEVQTTIQRRPSEVHAERRRRVTAAAD